MKEAIIGDIVDSVGRIAKAIWGMPLHFMAEIKDYLPYDMQKVLMEIKMKRPLSYKKIIDTCYYRSYFSEAAWDDFDNEERRSLQDKKDNAEKRRLMASRGKA